MGRMRRTGTAALALLQGNHNTRGSCHPDHQSCSVTSPVPGPTGKCVSLDWLSPRPTRLFCRRCGWRGRRRLVQFHQKSIQIAHESTTAAVGTFRDSPRRFDAAAIGRERRRRGINVAHLQPDLRRARIGNRSWTRGCCCCACATLTTSIRIKPGAVREVNFSRDIIPIPGPFRRLRVGPGSEQSPVNLRSPA